MGNLSIPSDSLFMVAGDTDIFGIASYDSPSNYARSILGSEVGFDMQVREFVASGQQFRVLVLNPYQFPTAPFALVKWAFPSIDLRRRIYEQLQKSDTFTTIVLSHHPASMWNPTYDTTKENAMVNILIASVNTRFFLSGHRDRGEDPAFLHHGDVFEAVAAPLWASAAVGVATFDNRRAAYHRIRVAPGRPIAILTCPVPSNETSELDVFNQGRFAIRALVFNSTNVTLRVSGSVSGILTFDRFLESGVSLWSLPVDLPYGAHQIVLSGDWTGACNFTTGNTIVGFRERAYVSEGGVSYEFIFAWLFLFSAVIAVPIEPTGLGETFDRWVTMRSSEAQWLLAIAGGFIVVKKRLCQMPTHFRWILFAAVLCPIFLPAAFFKIEGVIAILWLWGYAASGRVQTLYVGAKLAVCYLACVITPLLLISSAAAGVQFHGKAVIVDIVIYIASIAANGYLVYYIMDICGVAAGLASPMFVFIPVILHALLWHSVVQVVKEQTRRTDAESLI
jgi:hypothetical protein